jgi:hypothetical protein
VIIYEFNIYNFLSGAFLGLAGLEGLAGLAALAALVGLVGLAGLAALEGLVGFLGLAGLAALVGFLGFVGLVALRNFLKSNNLPPCGAPANLTRFPIPDWLYEPGCVTDEPENEPEITLGNGDIFACEGEGNW